ncbi:BQ2448_5615 [Microbotryum intermedium]|uniref:DNA damage-binding protein CMR1 n=1 Tax=Microbotryum intermedium TaxID=269621 RepID=A0A238F2N3_9BASI|nr:BQ2448_5615 [Microbotryum intermedium]
MASLFAVRKAEQQKNAAALKALDFTPPAVSKPSSTASTATTKTKSTVPKKRPAPKRELPPREPTRARSTRMAAATGQQRTDEEIQAIAEANVKEEEEEKERLRIAKHGSRALEALTGVTGSLETQQLQEEFERLANYVADTTKQPVSPAKPSPSKTRRGASGSPQKAGGATGLGSANVDTKAPQKIVKSVKHRATVKIIPDRIYSMLVFAGDKKGHIGLWDATNAGTLISAATNGSIRDAAKNDNEDEEEEEEVLTPDRGHHYHWQGHLQNTVSQLKLAPNDPHKLYSSSYDCTLRCRDFTKDVDYEIMDLDRFDESEALVHSFDFTPSGRVLYAVDNNGGMVRRDLRQKMEKAERWYIDRAKVGCISINPANENMAVTAHLKKEMKLWDLRKFTTSAQETSLEDQMDEALLASYSYRNACSSAYFDWTGTKILSTCYDDYLRSKSIPTMSPTRMHSPDSKGVPDLQSGTLIRGRPNPWSRPSNLRPRSDMTVKVFGRYVSVFRAQWIHSPLIPSSFTIGNMKRYLDVYSADGTNIAHLADEMITAVPAVTAAHPTLGQARLYGGSASGKISFFKQVE